MNFPEEIFKAILNLIISSDSSLRVGERWLQILMPEYHTPFWNNVKFAIGICKSWVDLLLKLWT
jgi:hypothetical protein